MSKKTGSLADKLGALLDPSVPLKVGDDLGYGFVVSVALPDRKTARGEAPYFEAARPVPRGGGQCFRLPWQSRIYRARGGE